MDYQLFKAINRLAGRNSMLDKYMIAVSKKYYFLLIIVLIYISLTGYIDRKVVKKALVSYCLSISIAYVLNQFFYKPRPFLEHQVNLLIPAKKTSSFPSKHTLFLFVVSSTLFFHDRIVGSYLWGLSVLTGISRVWLGHHYPFDILGSAIIGSMTSSVVERLENAKFSLK
ncbi:undecaprenyl-diphosphatase [Anaerobacillus alkaliphilus]|uniref:Undecaprenyl-diphosphatase n=1 Tax=Anaerobacillus alkaliphilus TaxID=1548597 RepID=A0A4Q0W238_9BACI|nr:undecaprenyl-diphosphatase [Anaerobacillus alkaliphilus]RXJ04601.1 undecaprenyl-diphosphatase [Anaerobacillus alkaliphilus]